MTTQKEITIDKSKWSRGPWDSEPDHEAFEHLGFPCIIHRVASHGALCGYVAVPPGHPWHGKTYDDLSPSIHGGLTYGERCQGDICHVPKPGEPDDVWWLGFDHAHCDDLAPGYMRLELFASAEYRDIEYARTGVRSLAAQAAQAAAATREPKE